MSITLCIVFGLCVIGVAFLFVRSVSKSLAGLMAKIDRRAVAELTRRGVPESQARKMVQSWREQAE